MIKFAESDLDAPLISEVDVQRFSNFVTIRDLKGFTAALTEFYREKIPFAVIDSKRIPKSELRAHLAREAASLSADKTWAPTATDLQRGRAQLLSEFNTPQNLPLAKFATLANKSRQQIYKDVKAKRLLALSIGSRGQRIPDWQLEANGLELTRQILATVPDVDEWTLFHALSEPLDALHGKSPIKAANKVTMNKIVSLVLNSLGVHT